MTLIPDYNSIFRSASSTKEVISHLSMFDRLSKFKKIYTQIVYHANQDFAFLNKIKGVKCKSLNDKGFIITISRTVGKIDKRYFEGIIMVVPSEIPRIYRLITICDTYFWNYVVLRFIENSYPKLTRIFFSQTELKSIMTSFEKGVQPKADVLITDLTMKEKRITYTKNERKKAEFDSERKWTESSITLVFDEAAERGQWFKSIGFSLYNKNNSKIPNATFKISKYGTIAQDHLFELTRDLIIPQMESFAVKKIELFENRGLKERNYLPSKPLAITFETDIFDTTVNVRRFTTIMKKYPNSSKAIFHGNPYFHASIADFVDGSSFEIWILNTRRILILPQAKSSAPSFERLVGYIFSEFREGDIAEYGN